MPRTFLRVLPLAIAALLATGGIAHAATFTSSSTTTTIKKFGVYTSHATPANTATFSGTANGSGGVLGDALCMWQDASGVKTQTVASSFSVTTTFSVTNADDIFKNMKDAFGGCRLRTVPQGTVPTLAEQSAFAGPTLYVAQDDWAVANNKLHDYFIASPEPRGLTDFDSFGNCGLDDMRVDANDAVLTRAMEYGFYCNDFTPTGAVVPNTPYMLVDGKTAFTPDGANATRPGYLPLTYTTRRNPLTGQTNIVERDQLMACAPDATFPNTSCTSYTPLPVRVDRTIDTGRSGRTAYITDHFTSTDHATHTVKLWTKESIDANGSSPDVSVKLPGLSTYTRYMVSGALVPVPAAAALRPGVLYQRRSEALPNGTLDNPVMATVFSRTPSQVRISGAQDDMQIDLGTFTTPATGFAEQRRAYEMSDSATELATFGPYDLDWAVPPTSARLIASHKLHAAGGSVRVRLACPKTERRCDGSIVLNIHGHKTHKHFSVAGGHTKRVRIPTKGRHGKATLTATVHDMGGNTVTLTAATRVV